MLIIYFRRIGNP